MNDVEQANSLFLDADMIIKARIDRSEIQMLCKLVEGLGHLGVVTTTDKVLGEVMSSNHEALLARVEEGH